MFNNDNILLSVRDLRVYFRGNKRVARAVDGISYKVRKGQTVCLVGESGCGKTVSALTILGLISQPPGEIVGGQILFKGQDLLDLGEEEMRRIRGNRIAMVFQEPMTSLNPVFTIGDQIREAIIVHEKVSESEIRQRCVQLLEDVGIPLPEERLAVYPHELSGGQRQRVMIAMALACNPELVIADEPTTALDVTIQAQILNLFGELQRKQDMSLFYITHDLGVVAGIADRIYVMYAGTIVEQGDAYEIFYDPSHPYTRGLLASLPNRAKRDTRLHSIPGAVPDPGLKPGGCPFHPRCDSALETCRRQFPEMCDYGKGHLSRCPVLYSARGYQRKAKKSVNPIS
ncbi:MAG: peptide ABC transporter ATP-binding protein [Desulfobacterales bacterium C00003060]|nr:MAG: peptide ABC transporter ATP-binding protein [Desulfobacterales bacterium S3730MH5]OEU77492.1 MAG: peptide ABC transporter ATP-binding protein [Desulfobacterales bacterium C00003060]OEU82011.1 MAG: peptide ABC transporter ATP-binding protein [Desulfobacterales bacterium S5133MH4]